MGEAGMIVTLLGESYANFGYFGIILIPFLTAYWLGRAYFRAYRNSYFSVARFFYLMIACNLIQVYRDGLISIVVFTFINMMPLALIVLLHYLLPIKHRTTQTLRPAAAGGADLQKFVYGAMRQRELSLKLPPN
jgi:hypothetical protein